MQNYNITSSDSEVMIEHNKRKHKFKCTIENETFKEECLIKSHCSKSHAQKKKQVRLRSTLVVV